MSGLKDVTEFARHAFRAEFLTPAGIINLIWQVCVLTVVVVLGLADLWQAIARTWNSHYTTHLPSFLVLLPIWGGIMLACVLIVGLLTRRSAENH
jgi:hypothetical protein